MLDKSTDKSRAGFNTWEILIKDVNFSQLWALARKSGISDDRFTLVLNRCFVQAVEANDLDIMRLLAKQPEVDINFCDFGDQDLVIPTGGGRVILGDPSRQPPLVKALAKRRTEAALLSLELDADPNWVDAHGWRPLDHAIRHDMKIVEAKLKEMGAKRSDDSSVRAFADKWRGRYLGGGL